MCEYESKSHLPTCRRSRNGVPKKRGQRPVHYCRRLHHVQRLCPRPHGISDQQRALPLPRQRGQTDHREVLLHRLRSKVSLYQRQPHHALPVHLPLPPVFRCFAPLLSHETPRLSSPLFFAFFRDRAKGGGPKPAALSFVLALFIRPRGTAGGPPRRTRTPSP